MAVPRGQAVMACGRRIGQASFTLVMSTHICYRDAADQEDAAYPPHCMIKIVIHV